MISDAIEMNEFSKRLSVDIKKFNFKLILKKIHPAETVAS